MRASVRRPGTEEKSKDGGKHFSSNDLSRSTSIDGVFTRRGQPAEALNMPINCGNIRIYAGQPDPVDHSHFTMKYEIDNFPGTLFGTIDGWLQNDDTVKMQFRDDPAKLVATMPASLSAAFVSSITVGFSTSFFVLGSAKAEY